MNIHDDNDDELFLWNGWPTKGWSLILKPGILLEIRTIANLEHAASSISASAEPEFSLCWMKLCSSDNHHIASSSIFAKKCLINWISIGKRLIDTFWYNYHHENCLRRRFIFQKTKPARNFSGGIWLHLTVYKDLIKVDNDAEFLKIGTSPLLPYIFLEYIFQGKD